MITCWLEAILGQQISIPISSAKRIKRWLKIENDIIIGCSGNANDAYLLLSKYCNFSKEHGMTCKENIAISYLQIIEELNKNMKR